MISDRETTSPMNFDALRYVGAVTREIHSRMHEGRPARVLIASCAYDTSQSDLWDAITNPERIPRWFLPVSGDFRIGGHYQLEGNAGGQITDCQPPRYLALTWGMGGDVSWVNVELSPLTDGGARLRLEHIAHVPDEFWNEYGPGVVGWDLALLGLRYYFPVGERLDHDAWPLSDSGKIFVSQSSEAWADASIASGTDDAAARAGAKRITSMYTQGA